jgi:hypothetical protein
MVEIIGLGTLSALVWLIAWSMAGESESEKRRMPMHRERGAAVETGASETRTRYAA